MMLCEPTNGALLAEYQRLRDAGIAAGEQGRFDDAEPLLARAIDVARRTGDQHLEDIAFCNWSGVRVELGRMDEVLPSLREILLRSDHPADCRLAAYTIARIYELRSEARKGLFYARIARDRTKQIDNVDPSWIAGDHNLIANFLVADSRFGEALGEYQAALAAQPAGNRYGVAALWQNVGYCHLMLGRPKEAFTLLFRSIRAFRRIGATPLLALNHLDLAYACLEVGRTRSAVRHAQRALELARGQGDEHNIKNALYLLGEALHLGGDEEKARTCFEQLSECYDSSPFIADFLLSVDVRPMLNLRA